MPSWRRMLAICSGLEIFPASTCAGSPPTQLNRMKISRITPAMVGIICQIRRITYAVIRCLLLHRHALLGHVDVEPDEIRIQDRVLLVALHPRVQQVIEDAMHPEAPRSVHEDEPIHLAVEAVALLAVGQAERLLVEAV